MSDLVNIFMDKVVIRLLVCSVIHFCLDSSITLPALLDTGNKPFNNNVVLGSPPLPQTGASGVAPLDIHRIAPSLCPKPDGGGNNLAQLHCQVCHFLANTEIELDQHMEEHR